MTTKKQTTYKYKVGDHVIVRDCAFCGRGSTTKLMRITKRGMSDYAGTIVKKNAKSDFVDSTDWSGCDACCTLIEFALRDELFVYGFDFDVY